MNTPDNLPKDIIDEILDALEDLIVVDCHGNSPYDDLVMRLESRIMPNIAKLTLIDVQKRRIQELEQIIENIKSIATCAQLVVNESTGDVMYCGEAYPEEDVKEILKDPFMQGKYRKKFLEAVKDSVIK